MSTGIPYLSAEDVAACGPAPAESIAIAEAALAAKGAGETAGPRWEMGAHGSLADAPALSGKDGLATLVSADGAPLAVMDRESITTLRIGATTAVAAKQLADPASEVLVVLGCNARGKVVMESLFEAFPEKERMLCWDPDVERQAAFADEIMTTHNVASIIPPDPQEATEGAQILVSCLPVSDEPSPVVEPGWLQTGTLCIAWDLDAMFTPAVFSHADRVVTDSLAGWNDCQTHGHMEGLDAPSSDMAAIATGSAPGRGEGEPIILVSGVGEPAVDAALAADVLARAQAAGKGTPLSS
jgi:ornithine cyclodeaminase/alanine dehydrogenase-like protein (mu-crystallin family)